MDLSQNDFDRLMLFEHVLKTAEMNYEKDPLDADNLTKWGGALIELSQFQNLSDSKKMIEDAISKLEKALVIEPKKHDALWCLGNARTSLAFVTPEYETAKSYFEKASECYLQAINEDPENELYVRSLDMIAKAPELHKEIHKHEPSEQVLKGRSSNNNAKDSKKKKSNDLTYDIFGWVILAVGIFAWIGMAKSHIPPPPPS